MRTGRGTGACRGTGRRRDGNPPVGSTSSRRLRSLSARAPPFCLERTALPNMRRLKSGVSRSRQNLRDGASFRGKTRLAAGESAYELPLIGAESARPRADIEGLANTCYGDCVIVRVSDLTGEA
jgi:hypothetical protein